MKKLLLAILLMPFGAFGQVAHDNGVCGWEAVDANTGESGTAFVGCSFEPDVVVIPPDPDPVPIGYTEIVAFGDSWTDSRNSQSRNRFDKWVVNVADDLGLPLENTAVSGQILRRITSDVNNHGVFDPGTVVLLGHFENDLRPTRDRIMSNGCVRPDILSRIQSDLITLVATIKANGVENFVMLNLPDGTTFEGTAGLPVQIVNCMTNQINAARVNALSVNGMENALFDVNPIFVGLIANGIDAWADSQHPSRVAHELIAQGVVQRLSQ